MDNELYLAVANYCQNKPRDCETQDFDDWHEELSSMLKEKFGRPGIQDVSLWWYSDDDSIIDCAEEILDFSRRNKIIAHAEYWDDNEERTLVAMVSTPFLIQ